VVTLLSILFRFFASEQGLSRIANQQSQGIESEAKNLLESTRHHATSSEASKHLLRADSDTSMKWTACELFAPHGKKTYSARRPLQCTEDPQAHAVEHRVRPQRVKINLSTRGGGQQTPAIKKSPKKIEQRFRQLNLAPFDLLIQRRLVILTEKCAPLAVASPCYGVLMAFKFHAARRSQIT